MVSNSKLQYWFKHIALFTETKKNFQYVFPDSGKWCVTDGLTGFVLGRQPEGLPVSEKAFSLVDMCKKRMGEQNSHLIECEIVPEMYENSDGEKKKMCSIGESLYNARYVKAATAVFGKHFCLYTGDGTLDWLWIYPSDRYGNVDFNNYAVVLPVYKQLMRKVD